MVDLKLLDAVAPFVDFSSSRDTVYGLEDLSKEDLRSTSLLPYVKDLKGEDICKRWFDCRYLLYEYPIAPDRKEITLLWKTGHLLDRDEIIVTYEIAITPAEGRFCLADIVLGVGRLVEMHLKHTKKSSDQVREYDVSPKIKWEDTDMYGREENLHLYIKVLRE